MAKNVEEVYKQYDFKNKKITIYENKGITMIALVITVIIILIIASIATRGGTETVDNAKFSKVKSQFEVMQDYANQWYEEKILNYGEEISGNANEKILAKMKEDLSVDDFTTEGYKYFSADYIKNTLKIDGIDSDFLINMSNATVLLFGGTEYEGKIYYSADDFGIEVVDYQFNKDVSFDTTTKIIENKGYIIVYNIKFSEDISKYDVQYKKDGETDWKTLKVNSKKKYEYPNDTGNIITDNNAWYIVSPVPIDDIEGRVDIKIITKSSEVVSETKLVNIKWIESIQFETRIESDKVIADNVKFLDKESQEVKLNTYYVRYRNNGEKNYTELTYDSTQNYWYLTANTSGSGNTDYGDDYVPYIDGEEGEEVNINIWIKVFTKSVNVASEEKNESKTSSGGGYDSYIEKTITEEDITEAKTKFNNLSDKAIKLKDREENIIWVPKDFKIISGVKYVRAGIAVQAPDGSQFVWVPVEDINTMVKEATIGGNDNNGRKNYQGKLYDFTSSGATEKSDYGQGTRSYREPSLVTYNNSDTSAVLETVKGGSFDAYSTYYKDILGYNSAIEFGKAMQEDFNEMAESVDKYGGFYIGRYETSLRTEEDGSLKKDQDGNDIAIVQSISGVMSFTGGTKINDEYLEWYGLYKLQKEYSEKNNLTNTIGSSMIWGSQYDQMMIWMQKNNINVTSALSNTYRYESGTLKGELPGGSNSMDKLNNIYDLMDCHYEWTLEANTSTTRITRGGVYSRYNGTSPCDRSGTTPHVQSIPTAWSSRISLFIKK